MVAAEADLTGSHRDLSIPRLGAAAHCHQGMALPCPPPPPPPLGTSVKRGESCGSLPYRCVSSCREREFMQPHLGTCEPTSV